MTDLEVRPFRMDVPEEDLVDLRRRIEATRWPSKELVEDRSQGVQLATMQELARYWTTDYDWRKAEALKVPGGPLLDERKRFFEQWHHRDVVG
jgi:hypothetical protein